MCVCVCVCVCVWYLDFANGLLGIKKHITGSTLSMVGILDGCYCMFIMYLYIVCIHLWKAIFNVHVLEHETSAYSSYHVYFMVKCLNALVTLYDHSVLCLKMVQGNKSLYTTSR